MGVRTCTCIAGGARRMHVPAPMYIFKPQLHVPIRKYVLCVTYSMELQVIQSYKPRLVTAVQDSINAIGDKCRASGLITEDTYSQSVLIVGKTNADKARCLLEAVTNCIKLNPSCYEIFMKILAEELPDGSKKILDDMNEDMKASERKLDTEFAECTDDTISKSMNKKQVSNTRPVIIEVPRTMSINGSQSTLTTVSSKRVLKSHKINETDGVHSPIPESSSNDSESAYLFNPPETSARRRTLKHALELIQMADMDAQQDEAHSQELQHQNTELRGQRKQLKRAMEKEKKLAQKLEGERKSLEALISEKTRETDELKREIKALKIRLSGTEAQRNNFSSKCSELEQKLSSRESEYSAKITTKKDTIKRLEEKLKYQELRIERSENTVVELSRKVEELIRHNKELLKQHSMKDEEILSLQHKLNLWQKESLERGHRCSQLTQVFVSWFLLMAVGILIVSVAFYKFVNPSN